MKILVTGGAGFIGNQVVKQLQDSHQITSYDNYTGYGVSSYDELHSLHNEREEGSKAHLLVGDLREHSDVNSAVRLSKAEVVIHLAAFPRAKIVDLDPVKASAVMSTALINLLETCRIYKVRRFVYISSSMVYGNFNSDIVNETTSCNPIGTYAILKYAGELLVREFCLKNQIEYVIVRPSAVYGPMDVADRVVAKFLTNAMSGAPIVVKGPNELLDFTYVTDAAQGICLAATSCHAVNKIYNITYGQARTLLEAAILAKRMARSDSEIVVEQKDASFPSRGTLGIELAISDLNYSPIIGITQGFKLYYDWLNSSIYRTK